MVMLLLSMGYQIKSNQLVLIWMYAAEGSSNANFFANGVWLILQKYTTPQWPKALQKEQLTIEPPMVISVKLSVEKSKIIY